MERDHLRELACDAAQGRYPGGAVRAARGASAGQWLVEHGRVDLPRRRHPSALAPSNVIEHRGHGDHQALDRELPERVAFDKDPHYYRRRQHSETSLVRPAAGPPRRPPRMFSAAARTTRRHRWSTMSAPRRFAEHRELREAAAYGQRRD